MNRISFPDDIVGRDRWLPQCDLWRRSNTFSTVKSGRATSATNIPIACRIANGRWSFCECAAP